MTLAIEQGLSALIRRRAQEVRLDSAPLVEGWRFDSGLGTPECRHVPDNHAWRPIELDLVQPVRLDHGNGRTTLLDGADSGLPTLRRELESWFLGQLSRDERIEEATCGDADGWSLAEFRSAVAGASYCVLPVAVWKQNEKKKALALDDSRAGQTQCRARAGLSTGVSYIKTPSERGATLVVGGSFVVRRREDGSVVADVPRQVKLNSAEAYYTRVSFPWLAKEGGEAVNQT